MSTTPQRQLPRLCDDVMIHIARMSVDGHPKRNLDNLRTVCRSLRRYCIPLIFRDTVVQAREGRSPFERAARRINNHPHIIPFIRSIHILGWIQPRSQNDMRVVICTVTTRQILEICTPLVAANKIIIDQIFWLDAVPLAVPARAPLANITTLVFLGIATEHDTVIYDPTLLEFIARFPNLLHFELVPERLGTIPMPGLDLMRSHRPRIPSIAFTQVLSHHELMLNVCSVAFGPGTRDLSIEFSPHQNGYEARHSFQSLAPYVDLRTLAIVIPLHAYHRLPAQDRCYRRLADLISTAPRSLSAIDIIIDATTALIDTEVVAKVGQVPACSLANARRDPKTCTIQFILRSSYIIRDTDITWKDVQRRHREWRDSAIALLVGASLGVARREDLYYNYATPASVIVTDQVGDDEILIPI